MLYPRLYSPYKQVSCVPAVSNERMKKRDDVPLVEARVLPNQFLGDVGCMKGTKPTP